MKTLKNYALAAAISAAIISFPMIGSGQVLNNNSQSGQYLNDKAATDARNSSGSCDSTCGAGGSIAASSMETIFQQRVVPCGAGFTGKKLQERKTDTNGTFTAWTDSNTSQCAPI